MFFLLVSGTAAWTVAVPSAQAPSVLQYASSPAAGLVLAPPPRPPPGTGEPLVLLLGRTPPGPPGSSAWLTGVAFALVGYAVGRQHAALGVGGSKSSGRAAISFRSLHRRGGGRRATLAAAAAVASSAILPHAALAGGTQEDRRKDPVALAAGYKQQAVNSEGDPKVFTPKAIIDGAGVKSSLVKVRMPDPGPLTAGDYVDTIYIRSSLGDILGAGGFLPNGKGIKDAVDGSQKAPEEPTWKGRVEAGTGEVIPGIHTAKGLWWEGKPVFIK